MSNVPPDPPIRMDGPLKPSDTGRGIAIGGILVGIFVVFLLGAVPLLMLLPAINGVRTPARRNGCLNNMRQLAIAVQNHESAQKRYPTASDGTTDLLMAQTAGGHGDALAASDDGFSWLYHLLPYLEEEILYKEMKKKRLDDDLQTGPFDADFVSPSGEHFATMQISSYRCPTYSGDITTSLGDVEAAVGNYCAIVGTDLTEGAIWKTTPNWENGALPSACWNTPGSQTAALQVGTCLEKGLRLKRMGDGISKTIIATESREQQFSAWISGASMWVVAATPNSLAADGAAAGRDAADQFIAVLQADGTSAIDSGVGLAINFGSEFSPPAADHYLQAGDWATGRHRAWGPSSEHAGNVVIHVFADAHAQAISADINPTVYLRFVTRSEGDPSVAEALE